MVRQITVGVSHCQELAKGPLCCVPLQLTHINLKHICSSSVAHLHKTQALLNIHGNLGASSWSEAHVRKQNFNYYIYNTTARLLIFTAHLFLCQPVSRQMCVCVILANSSSFVTVKKKGGISLWSFKAKYRMWGIIDTSKCKNKDGEYIRVQFHLPSPFQLCAFSVFFTRGDVMFKKCGLHWR